MENDLITLAHVQGQLISSLRRSIDQEHRYAAERLNSCLHYGKHPSFCRHSYCVACSRLESIKFRDRAAAQIAAATTDHPGAVPLLLTGTTKDCELSEIAERIKRIGSAWRKLSTEPGHRSPLVSYGQVEVVPAPTSEGFNVHVHGVHLYKPGWPWTGRRYFRQSLLEERWADSLGPLVRDFNWLPSTDLPGALMYASKAYFTVADFGTGQRYRPEFLQPINSIRLLHGDLIRKIREARRGARERFLTQ